VHKNAGKIVTEKLILPPTTAVLEEGSISKFTLGINTNCATIGLFYHTSNTFVGLWEG